MKSDSCFGKVSNKPLSVYGTRKEAKEAAEFILSNYNRAMSPYKCDTCGKWHLALDSRKTPSKTCSECLDGLGRPKEAYSTKKGATTRAWNYLKEMGQQLNVYKCPHGKGWHLTKGV